MNYKILHDEYINLSLQSKDFRIDDEFRLETLLERFLSHPDTDVSLDIARDYLYFGDLYNVKVISPPKFGKDYGCIINPYKGCYER